MTVAGAAPQMPHGVPVQLAFSIGLTDMMSLAAKCKGAFRFPC
jgi:hypothetical protein